MKITKEEYLKNAFREILETNSNECWEYGYTYLTEDIEDIVDVLLEEISKEGWKK